MTTRSCRPRGSLASTEYVIPSRAGRLVGSRPIERTMLLTSAGASAPPNIGRNGSAARGAAPNANKLAASIA